MVGMITEVEAVLVDVILVIAEILAILGQLRQRVVIILLIQLIERSIGWKYLVVEVAIAN